MIKSTDKQRRRDDYHYPIHLTFRGKCTIALTLGVMALCAGYLDPYFWNRVLGK